MSSDGWDAAALTGFRREYGGEAGRGCCSHADEEVERFAPDIENQIDRIWDSFWSGGISNPLAVIEQITHLLFIRRLDDLQAREENRANRVKRPMERRIFGPNCR